MRNCKMPILPKLCICWEFHAKMKKKNNFDTSDIYNLLSTTIKFFALQILMGLISNMYPYLLEIVKKRLVLSPSW